MPPRDKWQLFLSEKHLNILMDLLQQHVPEATVWVYGSRVTGNAHSGSDLDVVLLSNPNPADPVRGCDDLKEALSDSMLPMIVDVHQWAHLPPSFHHNIQKDYIVLQEGKACSFVIPEKQP